MWDLVEKDLVSLLMTRVFHTLKDDPGYVELFHKAGLTGNLPTDLSHAPDAVFREFNRAVLLYAQGLRTKVVSKKSLRERRAKAVVIEGPGTLYRLWSNKDGNRKGPWWFTDSLLHEALNSSDSDRAKTTAWLRDRLAISFDYSACDRIAVLNLGINSALPAIEAWGLPMPQYSANALQKASLSISLQDYWAKHHQTFQGQKSQYYLPFVPASRLGDFW